MGYYYDGNFSVEYNNAHLISMSLDTMNLQLLLDSDKFGWGADAESFTTPVNESNMRVDTVANILEYLGWEEEAAEVNKEKNIVREGYIDSAKYNSIINTLLGWMASHGVKICATCNGEDGISWKYSNPLGEFAFKEERLTAITESELQRYKRLDQIINQISEASSEQDKLKLLVKLLVS
jgi:hypothetical protein